MSDLPQALMDDRTLRPSSMVNRTATFSSLTMGSSTRGVPSLCWRGYTTREALVQSSTTCQTDGAYTFGWCLQQRCLCDSPVGKGVCSRGIFNTEVLGIKNGSTLEQHIAVELVSLNCTLTIDWWQESALEGLDWQQITPSEWGQGSVTAASSEERSLVCRFTAWP